MCMETVLEKSLQGKATEEMKAISERENITLDKVIKRIAQGRIVIMQRRDGFPLAIGEGCKTKINANIGTSSTSSSAEDEVEKAKIAEKYGADTISDLSMGGDIDEIRKQIFAVTSVPITTVPIYQTLIEKGSFSKIREYDIIRTIKKHVKDGVSSIVIHAGFTMEDLDLLRASKRIMGMVSRGGSFISAWMIENNDENPMYSSFDRIIDIAREKDVIISFGNSMRSGCIHDLKDTPQEREIYRNAKLSSIANNAGVQVIIEGLGGHVNPLKIEEWVLQYKKLSEYRPLFVAGPLPIDIAVGYDHIAAAVGGSLAAGAGADYLCYITPAEHLCLPNKQQVRDGVIAAKIAAHIGDTIKYGMQEEDKKLAFHRVRRDWHGQFRHALDPDRAMELHPKATGACDMCGKYCALKITQSYLFRGYRGIEDVQ